MPNPITQKAEGLEDQPGLLSSEALSADNITR